MKLGEIIWFLVTLGIAILIVLASLKYWKDYHYKCITIDNEKIYCEYVDKDMIGVTKDGRTVKLKEYKEVLREEK